MFTYLKRKKISNLIKNSLKNCRILIKTKPLYWKLSIIWAGKSLNIKMKLTINIWPPFIKWVCLCGANSILSGHYEEEALQEFDINISELFNKVGKYIRRFAFIQSWKLAELLPAKLWNGAEWKSLQFSIWIVLRNSYKLTDTENRGFREFQKVYKSPFVIWH